MRPNDLAKELGVNPKTLRAWLRRTFPRSSGDHGAAWLLTDDQVRAARRHFGSHGVQEPNPATTPRVKTPPDPGAAVDDRLTSAVQALTFTLPRSTDEARPPRAAGLYAWWVRTTNLPIGQPPIPARHPRGVPIEWSLLYVGIAPSRPGTRTVADRFTKDHRGGNIGGSTFRQSLAALLLNDLELRPRTGSDRSRLIDEVPLSNWIDQQCGATFAVDPRPWEVERQVIAALDPPLNLDHGTHPFRRHVVAARDALWAACGLPPRRRAP